MAKRRTTGKRGRVRQIESSATTAAPQNRDDYTPEYWRAQQDEAYTKNVLSKYKESELTASDKASLKKAEDRTSEQKEISDIARSKGYKPGKMSKEDWANLSDDLRQQAKEELRDSSAADREAAGNKMRGKADQWQQVGGQAKQVRSGARKKEAEAHVRNLNQQNKTSADEYMTDKLVSYGYKESTVNNLDYDQKRRLIAEIGHGEAQKSNIGDVSREERKQVIDNATPRQKTDAYNIALNPRAAKGLDTWDYSLIAAEKAGKEDIELPPAYIEDEGRATAPKYVKPPKKQQEEIIDF